LDFHPEWVADGDFEEAGGYQACQKIFSAVRLPSALLCSCDLMAIGAVRALQEKGLTVPGNISVVGFDNMEEAVFNHPPLDTVSFSPQTMGRLAADKMVQLLSDAGLKEKVSTLSGELIVRESTRKA